MPVAESPHTLQEPLSTLVMGRGGTDIAGLTDVDVGGDGNAVEFRGRDLKFPGAHFNVISQAFLAASSS